MIEVKMRLKEGRMIMMEIVSERRIEMKAGIIILANIPFSFNLLLKSKGLHYERERDGTK